MCALCHSGVGKNINQPAFSYKPGDDFASLATDASRDPDASKSSESFIAAFCCYINLLADCGIGHDPH